MPSIRKLSALALVLAVAVSGAAHACTASSAKVSGTFNDNGEFVVSGALDADGNPIKNVEGFVVKSMTMPEDAVFTASDYASKTLYVVGDLDFDNAAMKVASYTDCAKTAAATVASSSCSAKAASAKVASAGSGCSAKAASAKVASAGSSCSAKAADAKVAGAGAGCCPGASATTANTKVAGSSCSSKNAPTTAARADVRHVTYNVEGMKCGVGCVAKIQSVVKALEMDGVVDCEVNFEEKQAVVSVDKDVDEDAIQKAIAGAGYEVERVEEQPGDETATK